MFSFSKLGRRIRSPHADCSTMLPLERSRSSTPQTTDAHSIYTSKSTANTTATRESMNTHSAIRTAYRALSTKPSDPHSVAHPGQTSNSKTDLLNCCWESSERRRQKRNHHKKSNAKPFFAGPAWPLARNPLLPTAGKTEVCLVGNARVSFIRHPTPLQATVWYIILPPLTPRKIKQHRVTFR